ncbi:S46 family peptidase [Paraliomyxa miuraensis]|uniref:S46 family peptidase n=1 Tax=Paraliomyxa miuraensis TaxID=376150 RepID=UPI00225C3779|nr:S46 family peptidase [Paraliomyxa miuraensis]MCX4241487.1 S46 family peptidase [Paraliomyxa miuraensis]
MRGPGRRRTWLGAFVLLGVGIGQPGHADEGQWMPKQLAELPQAELKQAGLRLSPSELWNPSDGGLMRAVVNLSGCSAGFLSNKGLLATNHHCAYGAIQSNSSVEHDYLRDGFVAATLADELPARGSTVKVLVSIDDVTESMRKVAEAEPDPARRARAFEQAGSTMVATCEQEHPGHHCQVAEFYNGHEVQLLRYLELLDVRLVYAPPSSIGNYGGEVDNWMWPRHTGDFSMLRAYVGPDGKPAAYAEDNVPYVPERHFELGTEGVGPGDFVAILGYPGKTERYLPAVELRRKLEQFLPARVSLYGEWIELLERLGQADPAVRIKVAAKLRGLQNRHKNSRGMIEGIHRNGLLARRQAEDEAMAVWLAGQPPDVQARHAGVLEGLNALSERRHAGFERDFLIENLGGGANALAVAIDLVRRAREQAKPDLERRGPYQERGAERLWSRQNGRLHDYDAGVDEALMVALFRRIEALPPELRFTGFGVADVPRVLRATKVTEEAFAKAAFDAADAEALAASRDPLLVLAHELVEAIEQHEERSDRDSGELLVLGPRYFEMLEAVRGGPVYPDANGTLRFSHATVQGYTPRDGMLATPQTVLAGQVAKHTGQEPFDLAEAVRNAAPSAAQSYWSDPALGDVPVAFLANGDTTGGNSGSPVIDGQGRFIGLNFDRVWENIAGDVGWNQARSRNIIVDVRYLLWVLDEVTDAGPLLEELGVAHLRDAPPRSASDSARGAMGNSGHATPSARDEGEGLVGTPLDQTKPLETARSGTSGGGCACSSGGPSEHAGWSWLGGLLLMGVRRRGPRG